MANDGLRTKLNGEKIKEVADKYFRPKNVENLKTPTVNNNQHLKLLKNTSVKDCHDIAEILLKVALNAKTITSVFQVSVYLTSIFLGVLGCQNINQN
jgi:hypothetical protein